MPRALSGRLKNWDYSRPGHYFITICTYKHNRFLTKITNGQVILSPVGQIVFEEISKTIHLHSEILSLGWVIMPNHVHWLISIPVETPRGASLQGNPGSQIITHTHKNHPNFFNKLNQKSKQTIPLIINQFKSSVTRRCRQNNLLFAWQSGYYDEIIHSPKRLFIVQKYIKNNPKNWAKDNLY